jgi:hypothetical protein
MKIRILTFLCASVLLASSAQAALLITEVVDGDLSGGNPKFVEITNTGASNYTFTGGGIIMQANASADTAIDVSLTGLTINAGDSFVIQSTANGGQAIFESTYGFAADVYTPAGFGNGDDRYALALVDAPTQADIVDIYGDFGVQGTSAVWNYLDSYAFRKATSVTANGGVFVASDWTYGGPLALDAPADPARIALLLANTTPGSHVFNTVPEPGTAILALMSLAAAGAVSMRSRLG